MFEVNSAFEAGSEGLCELPLCAVRLQRDGRWPWLVLIPRAAGAVEIAQLAPAQRAQLMEEIVAAGTAVRAMGAALGLAVEKLNVGLLGNVTPQLHAHVVGRRAGDPAWPGPVWGFGEATPLAGEALALSRAAALKALAPYAEPVRL